ncbi:MAG TPA: DUF1667 domain-containing protein [Candidatus Aminicenantes bacterium]|nr:DUF1667 domain-containing protein [Candidatus Aminicenantes bacterium]
MSERAVVDRLTCVLCPVGCELEVRRTSADEADAAGSGTGKTRKTGPGEPRGSGTAGLEVRGNQCEKGVPFAVEEVLRPKRNLATSVPVKGTAAIMVSVRLSATVPREMIFPILAEIAKLRPETPVRRGQVLIANVLGTGVDVVATRTLSGFDPLFHPRKSQAMPTRFKA